MLHKYEYSALTYIYKVTCAFIIYMFTKYIYIYLCTICCSTCFKSLTSLPLEETFKKVVISGTSFRNSSKDSYNFHESFETIKLLVHIQSACTSRKVQKFVAEIFHFWNFYILSDFSPTVMLHTPEKLCDIHVPFIPIVDLYIVTISFQRFCRFDMLLHLPNILFNLC
jgi:hypothetical protein